jgi:Holliday junction resolvase RusA-like endonuclease
METGMSSSEHSERVICKIPLKMPSLNEYIRVCRTNPYKASKFKKDVENDISLFLARLPRFENPVQIHFRWIEDNKRRDLDNVAFGKKFILDAMVKAGVLKDDNRKCVVAFTDSFEYSDEAGVILEIKEVI